MTKEGSDHMTTYALNYFRDLCHSTSIKAGWWKEIENLTVFMRSHGVDSRLLRFMTAQVVGTKTALIHSEISEALEGYRKDAQDDHLPAFKSVDVELADALIRIFDLAGYLGCDLAGAVEAKMRYNRTRADHTAAARNAPGGKQF
jgi:NTP pyrophosphatase (non-canonical NTP hydrolase)